MRVPVRGQRRGRQRDKVLALLAGARAKRRASAKPPNNIATSTEYHSKPDDPTSDMASVPAIGPIVAPMDQLTSKVLLTVT